MAATLDVRWSARSLADWSCFSFVRLFFFFFFWTGRCGGSARTGQQHWNCWDTDATCFGNNWVFSLPQRVGLLTLWVLRSELESADSLKRAVIRIRIRSSGLQRVYKFIVSTFFFESLWFPRKIFQVCLVSVRLSFFLYLFILYLPMLLVRLVCVGISQNSLVWTTLEYSG